MKQSKPFPSKSMGKKSTKPFNPNRKQKLTRAEKKAKRNTHVNKYKPK